MEELRLEKSNINISKHEGRQKTMDEDLLILKGRVEALIAYITKEKYTPSKEMILAILGEELPKEDDD